MENMCRTCLRAGENKVFDLTKDQSLVSKIEVISSIQISLTDDYPKMICEECADNVNKFFCFRKVIINSDKEMREQHDQLRQRKTKLDQGKPESPRKITRLRKKRIKTAPLEENNENSDDFNCNQDNLDQKQDELNHNRNSEANTNDDFCDDKDIKYEDGDSESALYDDDDYDDVHESKSETSNSRYRKCKTKIYHCEKCNITFPSRSRLYSHKRGLHTTPAICNYCGVVIRSDNLKKHMQKHLEDPVTCKVCNKVFKNSESLRGHMILHRGLTFECKICARIFKIKSEYHRHMKCHADPNIRKVMCSVCGKRVRDMKKHLLTHTGERPYLCTHCNKGFTSTYALKIHSRQHTKERPFICEYCSLSFAQKVSLITHLKNKHGSNNN